jgi:hypothetical protein
MPDTLSRRVLLTRLLTAATPVALWRTGLFAQTAIPVVVYKDPSCGCCEKWVEHMKANGFALTVTNTSDLTSVNARYKVPAAVESCHTAIVGSYVVEGHVPAADVKRLLAEKPAGIIGLSIPGMPASAPGMDMTPFQPYTVITFDAKGATTVFARHSKV